MYVPLYRKRDHWRQGEQGHRAAVASHRTATGPTPGGVRRKSGNDRQTIRLFIQMEGLTGYKLLFRHHPSYQEFDPAIHLSDTEMQVGNR